jgi:hypothetical protein
MWHQGHGMALDHPIFNKPHKVAFEWTEAKRGRHHTGYTSPLYPKGMGETHQLARIEIDKPKEPNPTLVSHEGFFTDVPGFENLAEGDSTKMLGSLALARQGRYLYWAWTLDPKRLTAAGKDTFANAVHYIHSHRDSLTVEFVCKTRRNLWVLLELYHSTDGRYKRGIEEHFPGNLTPEWRKTYTATPEGCQAWLDKYHAYVFSGKSKEHSGKRYKTIFEVDKDALALGTPNAKRTSLERWMALAAGTPGEDRDRAIRCLKRYVHPSVHPKDSDWKAWYARQRDRIVFIESTGFWWQEDPRVLMRERNAARKQER